MDKKDHHANHKASQSRRKFLMRTGAGIVIASLPARSVWAGSGGIAQSIVASGHGSDFANGVPISLQSHGYFKNSARRQHVPNQSFSTLFGGDPFGLEHLEPSLRSSLSLLDILDNPGGGGNGNAGNKFGGPGNVNVQLVCIYLNAYFHNLDGYDLYYPIVGFDKAFTDDIAFARYLYNEADKQGPSNYGAALGKLICDHHAGGPSECKF